MAVAWTDFLVYAAVITELADAVYYFQERGKKHEEVRKAAEKYRQVQRKLFKNPGFSKFMNDTRTRLKFINYFNKMFSSKFYRKLHMILQSNI